MPSLAKALQAQVLAVVIAFAFGAFLSARMA